MILCLRPICDRGWNLIERPFMVGAMTGGRCSTIASFCCADVAMRSAVILRTGASLLSHFLGEVASSGHGEPK